MNKRYTLLAVGITFLLLLGIAGPAAAQGETERFRTGAGEVVFLLDASNSMNSQDRDRLAIDGIRQVANSLPSNYRTGLVVYNTGNQSVVPLSFGMEEMEAQLSAVKYTGYTNAGEGLSQAVSLFSGEEGVDRAIIMMSDGEIIMNKNQTTEESRALYVQAADRAREKGIKIYIVAIGNELTPQMHIFDGAELTDGAIYWEGQQGAISQIMNQLMFHRLDFPRRSLGVTDSGGGSVHAELPASGADRVKILLTSVKGLSNVVADYTAEGGRTTEGRRFAVVDIERPAKNAVDVHFQAPDLSEVEAYLIAEYAASPALSISYRSEEQPRTEEEIEENIPPEYLHFADLSIRMADAGGKNDNLWDTGYYEGREIPFSVNGGSVSGQIENGQLNYSMPIDGLEAIEVSVDTSQLSEYYSLGQSVTEELAIPADPVFVPIVRTDYRPLWVLLGALALALAAILLIWVKKSRTTVIYVAQPPSSREPEKKLETKNCTYTGKLNMYVVRTENGRDVPPQTYRLFGRQSGRMTLNQVLNTCGIKFGKIGADDIILYPGPDKSVIIMDQSERCTVLRGTEILKKGMGYPVFYNEKITITFEDEATEMEIHYKNLKPSERAEI